MSGGRHLRITGALFLAGAVVAIVLDDAFCAAFLLGIGITYVFAGDVVTAIAEERRK